MKNTDKNSTYQSGDADLLGGFLTQQKTMQVLNVGYTTLYYLRKNKKIKFKKIGAKCFYNLKSIQDLLHGNSDGEAK